MGDTAGRKRPFRLKLCMVYGLHGFMVFNGPFPRVCGSIRCFSRLISTVREVMDEGKRAAARYAVDTYVKV